MPVRAVDDKSSDTLVVVSGEGFWTGSSTLPHLHQHLSVHVEAVRRRPLERARPVVGYLHGVTRRRSGTDPRQSCAPPRSYREEPWTTSPFSSPPSRSV